MKFSFKYTLKLWRYYIVSTVLDAIDYLIRLPLWKLRGKLGLKRSELFFHHDYIVPPFRPWDGRYVPDLDTINIEDYQRWVEMQQIMSSSNYMSKIVISQLKKQKDVKLIFDVSNL